MRNTIRKFLVVGAAVSVAVACAPGERKTGGNGGVDADTCPGCTKLVGTIYAPKWAPGDVPPGQEIPVFGATIYVTDTRPAPIPQETFCDSCIETPQGSVTSNHDGSFELTVQGGGHFWLVIKKGLFRLEQEIDLLTGTVVMLPPAATTLPSKLDPQNGAWIPKVAIVRGNYDAIEDILGKIGFGSMSGNKLSNPDGEIAFYDWGLTGTTTATYLMQNIAEMRKYHIIFFPCSTAVIDSPLVDQNTLKNVRQFVADGGKLYVTDWSGEVADRAFPPQILLGGFGTDSVGTYDPKDLTGTLTTMGSSDGDYYDAPGSKAIDNDLNQWLGLQTGPSELSPVPAPYNPNSFDVSHNYNWIDKLNSVMKGTDDMGMPVYDDPKAWVVGSDGFHGDRPLAVTYEPTGCGKVLYSTFQTSGATADESHQGLMAQERVLLYLIMEIASCTEDPILF